MLMLGLMLDAYIGARIETQKGLLPLGGLASTDEHCRTHVCAATMSMHACTSWFFIDMLIYKV